MQSVTRNAHEVIAQRKVFPHQTCRSDPPPGSCRYRPIPGSNWVMRSLWTVHYLQRRCLYSLSFGRHQYRWSDVSASRDVAVMATQVFGPINVVHQRGNGPTGAVERDAARLHRAEVNSIASDPLADRDLHIRIDNPHSPSTIQNLTQTQRK